MIKVQLENGSEVTLKNRKWISDDPELTAALNSFSDEVERSSDYFPDRDEALALNVIKKLGGKIIFQTKIKYVAGRVY